MSMFYSIILSLCCPLDKRVDYMLQLCLQRHISRLERPVLFPLGKISARKHHWRSNPISFSLNNHQVILVHFMVTSMSP